MTNTTSAWWTVIVTANAPNFNKAQQLSTNGMQQVQYQSLRNKEFQ